MTTLAWSPARVREEWRFPLIAICALVLLLLLGHRDTALAMVEIWSRSETFTHAFVVPPIVAWLIWRKRGELVPLQPQPMPWMLLPMAGLALLWWLGHLVTVAAVTQLALTAMLVVSVPLVLGWQVTRVILFPLAFLFFAVPIGEFLTPTLMHWTAEALVAGLRLSGIPVYQEGQQLVIPSGRWAVVEACSGIRYLMATFMVGSLFAYLNYTSNRKRLIFMVISLVLPVVANWVRAYIIVMLGHLSNNEIATGVDHLVYGWIFFGIVILGLFFIGARWADADDGVVRAERAAQHALQYPQIAKASWLSAATVGLTLAVALLPVLSLQRGPSTMPQPPLTLTLPDKLGSWQVVPGESTPMVWSPNFAKPTLYRTAVYQTAAIPGPAEPGVAVHVSYYRGQGAQSRLVTSSNTFIDSTKARWHLVSQGQAISQSGNGVVTWRRAKLLGLQEGGPMGRDHLTIWQLYWIGGDEASGDIHAKLLQANLAERGQPDDAAAIHLVSRLPDDAAAQRQLAAFASENFNAISALLACSRSGC